MSGEFRREDFTVIHTRLVELLQGIGSIQPLQTAANPATLTTNPSGAPAGGSLATGGGAAEQDVSRLLQNLEAAFRVAHTQLESLPGLELSSEAQVKAADTLQETLGHYRKLRADAFGLEVWRSSLVEGGSPQSPDGPRPMEEIE